jgi:hypothetical protein
MALDTLVSVRMGVQELSARWLKTRRALLRDNQVYADRLVEMAKRHAGELSAFDDPLEAAVFSVFIEIMREMDKAGES